MTELLFSDQAQHYLFSGRTSTETFLFTVTSSEVNVIVRIVMPPSTLESMLIVQATQLGEGGTFILKPMIMTAPETEEETKRDVMEFIDDIIDKASKIQQYNVAKNETPEPVLDYLKTGLTAAKENIENATS